MFVPRIFPLTAGHDVVAPRSVADLKSVPNECASAGIHNALAPIPAHNVNRKVKVLIARIMGLSPFSVVV